MPKVILLRECEGTNSRKPRKLSRNTPFTNSPTPKLCAALMRVGAITLGALSVITPGAGGLPILPIALSIVSNAANYGIPQRLRACCDRGI